MTELSLDILPESAGDDAAIERLNARAFGPGRYARTAYRLRERVPPVAELCFVARVGTLLVGSVRMTRVLIGERVALLLGPLAVEPAFRNHGIGGRLIRRALDAAREAGYAVVILVGDEPFYARSGFKRIAPKRIEMPGPVDPNRLLVAELQDGAFEGFAGPVLPDLVWAYELEQRQAGD
jgi:predicted N-acetyltransferase YhbS